MRRYRLNVMVSLCMMVIWYDKCVCFHTTCSCSITCQKINGTSENPLFCQQSYREHRSIAFRSLLFLFADRRCGQMSVEYDQVRLAATGIEATCNAASLYV